jgi:hypothetical protein
VPYFTSILRLLDAFKHRADVEFVVSLPAQTLVIDARNALATRVLEDESFTHLLFIDADMGFRPELIARMLAFGEPYVGCFYPKRQTDFGRLIDLARAHPDADDVRERAQEFVGEPWRDPASGSGRRRGDFIRADHVGTGVLLLGRDVLERMRAADPALWLDRAPPDVARRLNLHGGFFQGFYPLRRPTGPTSARTYPSAAAGRSTWAARSGPASQNA